MGENSIIFEDDSALGDLGSVSLGKAGVWDNIKLRKDPREKMSFQLVGKIL